MFLWLVYVWIVYVCVNIFSYCISCVYIRVGFVFWVIDNSFGVLFFMFKVDGIKIGNNVYVIGNVKMGRIKVMG